MAEHPGVTCLIMQCEPGNDSPSAARSEAGFAFHGASKSRCMREASSCTDRRQADYSSSSGSCGLSPLRNVRTSCTIALAICSSIMKS